MSLALFSVSGAEPTGPTIRHGQVHITPGTQTQIQQLTDRAIVDWNSFSIGASEAVQFLQPGELSVILNRVVGGDPSTILGQLRSNGQVFLINPHGIVFGPDSQISVGGLVASTLNMSDESFLRGTYQFHQSAEADVAAVVNQGRIEVTDAGYAVLVGPAVLNEGTIIAKAGNVQLAAGESATLNLDGRDLIHFSLQGEVSDGHVLLAPGMLSEHLAQTLGVERHRRADKLVRMADGSVQLLNSSGTLVQSGVVSADGVEGEDAGTVVLQSGDLTVAGAGSLTSASGVGSESDGGVVKLLSAMDRSSPGLTAVDVGATLAASGGVGSGNAGFLEVSGNHLEFRGEVDLSYTQGTAGVFLLDPTTVRIVDGATGPTMVGLENHIGDGFIETMLAAADFTVMSDMDIIFDVTSSSGGTDTGIDALGSTNRLTLDTNTLSGNSVFLNQDRIITGGNVDIFSGDQIAMGSSEVRIGGSLRMVAGGDVNLQTSTLAPFLELSASGVNIDLGSSQGTSQGVTVIATGNVTGNGASLDSRGVLANPNDGGAMSISANGNINLVETNLGAAEQGALQALDIFADGDIRMEDGRIVTELIPGGTVGNETVSISADGTIIELADTSLNVGELSVDARAGDSSIIFRDQMAQGSALTSLATSRGTVDIMAANDVLVDDVTASNDLNLDGGSSVTVSNGSGGAVTVNAPLIQVGSLFGFTIDLTGSTIDLTDSLINAGQSLTANGDDVFLERAVISTDRDRPTSAPIPQVQITANNQITADLSANGGISSSEVRLSSNGDINVTLDTSISGTPTGNEVATRVTADSVTGSISIVDVAAAGTGLGIELARPGGLGVSSTDPSAVEAPGNITIESSGDIFLGIGSSGTPDLGQPIVQASTAGSSITLLADGHIRDRNFAPATFDLATVGGAVSLEAAGGVGEFGVNPGEGQIEFNGNSLVVRVSDPGAPIHVASSGTLNFVDAALSGGEVLIAEGGAFTTPTASLVNTQIGGSGPRVLQHPLGSGLSSAFVRVTSNSDLFLDEFAVNPGQQVILNTSAGASVLNGDPGGSNGTGPNVTLQTGAGNFPLILKTDNALGSEANPLTFSGGGANILGGTGGMFAQFTGNTSLGKLDRNFLTGDLSSFPPTAPPDLENFVTAGNIILDVQGDLDLNATVNSTSSGTAINVSGNVNLAAGELLAAQQNLLITADSLTIADGQLSAGTGLGLELGQDLGTTADLTQVSSGPNLVIGNTPGVSYHLQTGGDTQDLSWVNSLNVGGRSVTGNQFNNLTHLHTDRTITIDAPLNGSGDITFQAPSTLQPGGVVVNESVTAASNLEIEVGGSIAQGGSNGVLNAPQVTLESGQSIGALNNDLVIEAQSLALDAGANAVVVDRSGDLELNAVGLPGAFEADGTLRVRTELGDLTVGTDVTADEAAFVAGTLVNLPAQTTAQDLFLNSNVTTQNNLVLLANGGVFMGAGGGLLVNGAAAGLGLGTPGVLGTPGNPITFTAPNLALNPSAGNIAPTNTPAQVPTVTAAGITVNAQGLVPPTPPTPPTPGGIVPAQVADTPPPEPFAQNDSQLVEDQLGDLGSAGTLVDELADPTSIPLGWWNDDDFLKKKYRRKISR